MNRILALVAAASAIFAVSVVPASPGAHSAVAHHVAVEGPVVHLQAHADGPDGAWFDSRGLADAQAAQAAWLMDQARTRAQSDCHEAGFDGAEVEEVSTYMDFPQPWQPAAAGGFAGPAQVGVVVRQRCL